MIWLRVAPYVAIAVLAVASWFLSGSVKAKEELLAKQLEINDGLIQNIESLRELHEQHALQISALMDEQRRVAAVHSRQFAKLTRLQNDVQEIRDWAGQPLPDAIVRLRNRATTTGSHTYGAVVPEADSVPADGGEPEDKRGAEPRAGTGLR